MLYDFGNIFEEKMKNEKMWRLLHKNTAFNEEKNKHGLPFKTKNVFFPHKNGKSRTKFGQMKKVGQSLDK
jgi:hypothetical protein